MARNMIVNPVNYGTSDSTRSWCIGEIAHQGRRNEKKTRGAENFKKAHCNYFEVKPRFIDAQ